MPNLETTTLGVLCLLLVGSLAGCDDPAGPEKDKACRAILRPALKVAVEHAETGEPLDSALVVATDGAFADSARTIAYQDSDNFIPANLANERPGTYKVTAEKEGFSTWSHSGIEVTEGECHVNTVELTARLAPLSG